MNSTKDSITTLTTNNPINRFVEIGRTWYKIFDPSEILRKYLVHKILKLFGVSTNFEKIFGKNWVPDPFDQVQLFFLVQKYPTSLSINVKTPKIAGFFIPFQLKSVQPNIF